MRPVLAPVATLAIGSSLLLLATLLLAGCPTPQSPKGPPPEYEEPRAPSWLEAGSPTPTPTGAAGDPDASAKAFEAGALAPEYAPSK